MDPRTPRSKERGGIQIKFMVWFTGLFTAAYIVLGLMVIKGVPFSSFDGWSGNTRQEAIRSLDLIAELEKINLTRWFRERRGDSRVVAGNQMIRANLALLLATIHSSTVHAGPNKKRLPRAENIAPAKQIYTFLTSVKEAYAQSAAANYERIRIVDPKTAHVLVSTDAAENGLIVDPGEKYLVQVIRTEHYFVSGVSTAGPNSIPHINIAQPVFEPDGAMIGIVVLEIVLTDIFDHLLHNTHSLGATGEVLVVDEQSRILTPLRHPLSDGTQARLLEHQITAKPARFAASGREGLIESDDYRGHKVIAAYRHLRLSPNWGWGMIVKIDKAQLFAAMNKGLRYSVWFGIVGLLLIVVLSTLLTRRLTGPLRQMTRVANRMAAGDLAARTQVKTDDELGQLSSTFDAMADDIEHWHRDLERRIGERTTLLNQEIRVRKRTEEKYRQLAIRQSLVLDHAGEGIYGLDTKGHTTFANEAAVKLLGWNLDELLGKSQHDLIHHSRPDGSPYPREECHIYASFKDGKTHNASDEVFWRRDGTSFPIEYVSTPIREDGELTGAVVIFRDITERMQAEKKIRRLNAGLEKKVTARTAELVAVNQELESFAYSVAHDLRAPLRAIDGFSQALLEDYGERLDGEAKEFLGHLREGSQEMAALIDDLLKLSRATRGEISHQDIDLSQLAADCLQALRQTNPDRKVEVDIEAGIIVNADRRLMQVMLENLLENAWKFTARETTAQIQFGAESLGKKVRCCIHDNGVGFDMAYQNKLFTPFTRLHSKEDFEGTGIGLSTVQRIINRHGGTIAAQSRVGEGACFTFELDAAENDGHDEELDADD